MTTLTNTKTALKLSASLVFATLGLVATAPAQAFLIGKQMDAVYYFPDTNTQYASASFTPPTFTIGSGQETIGNVEGVTDLLVDFTKDMLTITLNTTLTNPTWTSASFNGIIFTSPSSLGLASASVAPETTMGGFGNSRVSFNANQILINWNGLSYENGTKVKVNFTPVPEPLTILGTATALGFGAFFKRKLKSSESAEKETINVG
jgi:hypothetical protein